MHPDTQMRSGCVEMIYPCNDDLWWHNGVSRGGSRCCECCGTRRVFTCGPCHAEFILSWWRHQMEIFSASLALCVGNSPVTGEFPAQMPVTRSFDVFSDLRLNKRFSKQSWGWWFETPVRSLWRHCKGKITLHMRFLSFLNIEMAQGVQIPPRGRQWLTYPMLWLLLSHQVFSNHCPAKAFVEPQLWMMRDLFLLVKCKSLAGRSIHTHCKLL